MRRALPGLNGGGKRTIFDRRTGGTRAMEKDPSIPFTPIPVTGRTGPRPGY